MNFKPDLDKRIQEAVTHWLQSHQNTDVLNGHCAHQHIRTIFDYFRHNPRSCSSVRQCKTKDIRNSFSENVTFDASAMNLIQEHTDRIVERFLKGRTPPALRLPKTKPDEAYRIVMAHLLTTAQRNQGTSGRPGIWNAMSLSDATELHSLSMAAENFVGEILEYYIATVLERDGWTWCSGGVVRAVDYMKPPDSAHQGWKLLQVKNRNNSENSSSRRIREGTEIKCWHRTNSKSGETNWANLKIITDASPKIKEELEEMKFLDYLREFVSNKLK